MAINLKKICRDIAHQDEDIQVMALTTIGQLTASSIEDPNDLLTLKQALDKAAVEGNPDIVFLARKALNKVDELARRVPAGRFAAAPGESAPPAQDAPG
ncbi:MAG: hypothetical protein HY303_04890, partial [Candidatus Wallbacteria bacterium]|nr:hypothetical protein [Candidatus Wallbacteria bacterium]